MDGYGKAAGRARARDDADVRQEKVLRRAGAKLGAICGARNAERDSPKRPGQRETALFRP